MSGLARDDLIDIQRRLVDEVNDEIEGSLGTPPAGLERYRHSYLEILDGPFEEVAIGEVVDGIATAGIVYFGDYHTLRESQKAPVRILRRILRRGRKVILGTEVFAIPFQAHLDAYLSGDLPEEDLLKEAEYEKNWGFPWRNHRLLIEFARQEGLEVIALNSDPEVVKDHLRARDVIAAMRIIESREENPDALLAVAFGDLHVVPCHLPAEVERLAGSRKLPRQNQVVVYQNSESIYWRLAADRREQEVDAVDIGGDQFCLINSTPLMKVQSYLNWQLNQEELEESAGVEEEPRISSNVLTDQVMTLVSQICQFLKLPQEGYDDFTVYTSRDLNLLEKIKSRYRLTSQEIREFRQQIENQESFFLTRGNLIYLGNLSLDHAAEEATHYINTRLAGHVRNPPDRHFEFYYRTLKEMIGFFGSKVVNHKRFCNHRRHYEAILSDLHGRQLTGKRARLRQISRDVLRHLDAEEHWLEKNGRLPRLPSLVDSEFKVMVGVTHSLGYILGDHAHRAVMDGSIGREEILSLFREPFEGPDCPRRTYFTWLERLRNSG